LPLLTTHSHSHRHSHYPPRDKRNIVCDAPFKAAFECDTMTIFTMNKYLSKHLLPADPPAC
jgi:chromatin remodeling complex protein RSC6